MSEINERRRVVDLEHPNEIVPYKILPQAVDSVKEVVTARLALFSSGRLNARRPSR